MSGYLWTVTANKNWAKVTKGMTVELLVINRSGKPSIKDIMNALEIKYSIKVGDGIPMSTFDFTEQ